MNKTATFEVRNLLSPLTARGIEKQLAQLPGISVVSMNPAGASATVSFDPTRVSPEQIQAAIEDCGFHCAGESLPRHVCDAEMRRGPGAPRTAPALTMAVTRAMQGMGDTLLQPRKVRRPRPGRAPRTTT
jgi:copper chaperone CopZ